MVVASPDFINIDEYAALSLRHRPQHRNRPAQRPDAHHPGKGWENQASIEQHPQGFAAFKAVIDRYTPQHVAEITGLTVESLYQAAEILAQNRPTAVFWSVGLASPAAQGSVHSLVNLQLLLGNLDLPGGGLQPLRPQNNSQGACDMGALPGFLPGYQS